MAEQQHRAKPWQWQTIERKRYHAEFSVILELRDRIEALEAPQSGSIDLSHLSDDEREKMARWIANPDRFEVLEVAQPAKLDSSLVERVADAIVTKATSAGIVDDRPARAAIRAVAAWLGEQKGYGYGWAIRLEQEAER